MLSSFLTCRAGACEMRQHMSPDLVWSWTTPIQVAKELAPSLIAYARQLAQELLRAGQSCQEWCQAAGQSAKVEPMYLQVSPKSPQLKRKGSSSPKERVQLVQHTKLVPKRKSLESVGFRFYRSTVDFPVSLPIVGFPFGGSTVGFLFAVSTVGFPFYGSIVECKERAKKQIYI